MSVDYELLRQQLWDLAVSCDALKETEYADLCESLDGLAKLCLIIYEQREYSALRAINHIGPHDDVYNRIEESDYDGDDAEWHLDDVCITGSTKEDKT